MSQTDRLTEKYRQTNNFIDDSICYAEKYIHTQQDYEGLWEEDGCYNTSLYQKTAGYHTYQQVGKDKNNKDDNELATCYPRYFLHTCI